MRGMESGIISKTMRQVGGRFKNIVNKLTDKNGHKHGTFGNIGIHEEHQRQNPIGSNWHGLLAEEP